MNQKVDKRVLYPVLMGFFIAGFCDIVAPISGRIAAEFGAEQQGAVSFLPTMVFLWFLLLSPPLAGLMNRIGRKAMVLAGYGFTVVGLMIPYAAGEGCDLIWYFIGFGMLGIGNTAIQVSVNPLLAAITPPERITSYLTTGQIFRNVSLLLLAPIVTMLIVVVGSWRLLLPIYALVTIAGGVWLWLTTVEESVRDRGAVGMIDCFRLLKNPIVAICAFGIAAFLAADVGIGFLSSRLLDNSSSILTSMGFYACRIVGTLLGAWLLLRYSDVKYLRWNMCVAPLFTLALFVVRGDVGVYILYGLLGFSMSCVFATLYAVATKSAPTQSNEVSGLMIMMVAAGAISGPVIGVIIRAAGDVRYGLLFVAACVFYLMWAAFKLKPNTNQ